MGISDATETNILKLIYQAVSWSSVATSTGDTNIGISLHTADPADAGSASTSEVGYTSYTRVNVARTTGGWTVTANSASPVATISFPTGTGGSGLVTHFATAKSNATPPTGAQEIYLSGTVTPNITTGNTVTPQLTTATTITLD